MSNKQSKLHTEIHFICFTDKLYYRSNYQTRSASTVTLISTSVDSKRKDSSDVGPFWHDSIAQLLQLHICDVNMLFTTSKRCSSGLRSGDCGGPGSAVNSLSSSGHKLELIWPLWHSVLTCWKPPAVDDTLWLQQDGHQWFSGRPWHLKDAQLVPRGPKYDKKISPTALPELLTPSFQVVCTKFWS